ncbi:hypothetical protein [Sphingomonas aerophila]|uniref:hypothetical protein n=1 Tax=Sphingomonas aerophila TaxID=1344948 RepID=UPI001C857FD3|nr:hypothetical protein [Sphingomonas aerophila]
MLVNEASAKRSSKDIALAAINKMKEQFEAGLASEGKRNFKHTDGERVQFSIRVANTALVLERVKVKDTEVEVREMTCPTVAFLDALSYYADRIKADEYSAQFAALDGKKEQRTAKLRNTRAEKKAAKPA